MDTTFENHFEGSTTRAFGDSKSFSSSGKSASWSTSYSTQNSWTVHAEITEFGYTTTVDDSGSDSYSESSGGISYTPGDEDDPRGPYETHGGGGGGGEGGGGNGLEDGEFGDELRRSPSWQILNQFMSHQWEKKQGHIVNVPYIIKPGDQVDGVTKSLVWRWSDQDKFGGKLIKLTARGDETSPTTLGKSIPWGWEFTPRLFNGRKMEMPIDGTGVSDMDIRRAKEEALKKYGFKGDPEGTWHHRSTKNGKIIMQLQPRKWHAPRCRHPRYHQGQCSRLGLGGFSGTRRSNPNHRSTG